MIERKVTVPEIALLAGTRVALGAGIGMLLSGKLSGEQRKAVGWTLALIGALTTIPLAAGIIFQKNEQEQRELPAA